MKISISAFHTQKLGNATSEYEDAFYFSVSPVGCKVAVSDGATEAYDSGRWAQMLTKKFVSKPPRCCNADERKNAYRFVEWVKPLQQEWQSGVDFTKLPWFAVDKAARGSFSSLLGISINLQKKYWQAVAIGDTNLFLIRDDDRILSWPLTEVSQFGSSPILVGSNMAANRNIKTLKVTQGRLQSGDIFMIATDAVAVLALTLSWKQIGNIASQDEFITFVGEMRKRKELKNDDTTLVIIRVEEV